MNTRILASCVLVLSLSACSTVTEKRGQDGHRYLVTSATTITDCNLMLDTYAGRHVQLVKVQDNDMLITGGLLGSERNRYICAGVVPDAPALAPVAQAVN